MAGLVFKLHLGRYFYRKEHFKIHIEIRAQAGRYRPPRPSLGDLLVRVLSFKFEDLLESTLEVDEKLQLKTNQQARKQTNDKHYHILLLGPLQLLGCLQKQT